ARRKRAETSCSVVGPASGPRSKKPNHVACEPRGPLPVWRVADRFVEHQPGARHRPGHCRLLLRTEERILPSAAYHGRAPDLAEPGGVVVGQDPGKGRTPDTRGDRGTGFDTVVEEPPRNRPALGHASGLKRFDELAGDAPREPGQFRLQLPDRGRV